MLTAALDLKIHEGFDEIFNRKTMSYLLQSVSTEVPCKELWKERRECENGNLLGICPQTKLIFIDFHTVKKKILKY